MSYYNILFTVYARVYLHRLCDISKLFSSTSLCSDVQMFPRDAQRGQRTGDMKDMKSKVLKACKVKNNQNI